MTCFKVEPSLGIEAVTEVTAKSPTIKPLVWFERWVCFMGSPKTDFIQTVF
jgi:hypothetical protein